MKNMIVLGKTRTIFIQDKDKPERLAIDVVATVDKKELIPIKEELLSQVLPNNGKVFVPNYFTIPEAHQYKLWELEESHTYEPADYKSRKYFLKREVNDLLLYEVFRLNANYETEKRTIETILRNSITIREIPLPYVMFTTPDNYVIGPVKLNHLKEEEYLLAEDNFVHVYKMEISTVTIEERIFTITDFLEENFVDYIDVANDERAVRDALKLLKEHYEFGELSRKVISKLSEIYTDKSGEIGERLERALEIIQLNTLSEESERNLRQQLLDLPFVRQVIDEQTEDELEKLLLEFNKKHRKLINDIERMEQILKEKNLELAQKEELIEQKHTLLHTIEESFSAKLNQIENEFAEAYVEYFLKQGIHVQQPNANLHGQQQLPVIPSAYVKVVDEKQPLSSLEKTLEISYENRKLLHIRDRYQTLHRTVLGSILFRTPVVIAGNQSFEIAQFIGRTYSANRFYTIVPEVNKFSFATLEYLAPSLEDMLSTVHLHNLHYTQGEFALKSYVELKKWEDKGTQLLILSFDNIKQARECIESLGCIPILDTEDFLNFMILPSKLKKLFLSQINLMEVEYLELTGCSTFIGEFEAWIEENHSFSFELSSALKNWLSVIASDLGSVGDKELKYVYKLFEHYITRLKRDEES